MTSALFDPIELTVATDPALARLVRMTAANAAMLSSMSVDRVEDVRMAAEEAFIYACSLEDCSKITIAFDVDDERVAMHVDLAASSDAIQADEEAATYADLILASVCDSYEKLADPLRLELLIKADV